MFWTSSGLINKLFISTLLQSAKCKIELRILLNSDTFSTKDNAPVENAEQNAEQTRTQLGHLAESHSCSSSKYVKDIISWIRFAIIFDL